MNSTSQSSRSYDFLWLILALLPLVTLSLLFAIHPQDYWWLLRVGKDTLASGAVPAVETMSWSRAGEPILYEPWLAGVIFWRVYDLGDASLTFFVRGLLIAITYGLIWFLVRRVSGPRLATILVLVVGLASSNNWEMRAQLFAYPLFVGCLYSLINWQSGTNKTLWILPVATILWSNLHGSFLIAVLLAGAAFVFGKGDRKLLGITLVLMMAGTLLNPRGLELWNHVYFMLTYPSNQQYSLEWQPPRNAGWQMNIFFAWVLLFAPLVALSNRKLSWMEWVWFLGFGWLAVSGTRYVIWFLFILVVLTAAPLADVTRGKLDPPVKVSSALFNIILACLFIPLPLFYLPGIRETWWTQAPAAYATDATPLGAEKWLKEHPDVPGPLWNDYVFGSYLLFSLPSRPIWLDSRFYPFPPEQMDEYVRISQGSSDWETVFQKEGINLLLLSLARQPRLIENVEASNAWCEQYRDPYAIIFSRCEPIQ